MFNPCYEHCYLRFGKQYTPDCDDKCDYAKTVKENKLLKEEMDRPIKTLGELAAQFCCLTECRNCPVTIYKYDKRTKLDKEALHEPCCSNLYKWIIDQSEIIFQK